MPHSIAIVGSGICGMCAAISLVADGHRVTIVERDQPPPEGSPDEAFSTGTGEEPRSFATPTPFLG